MTVQVGDSIPEVTMKIMGDQGPQDISTADIFSGKHMHMFYEFTTKELFPDAAKCFSKYFCAMQNICCYIRVKSYFLFYILMISKI